MCCGLVVKIYSMAQFQRERDSCELATNERWKYHLKAHRVSVFTFYNNLHCVHFGQKLHLFWTMQKWEFVQTCGTFSYSLFHIPGTLAHRAVYLQPWLHWGHYCSDCSFANLHHNCFFDCLYQRMYLVTKRLHIYCFFFGIQIILRLP